MITTIRFCSRIQLLQPQGPEVAVPFIRLSAHVKYHLSQPHGHPLSTGEPLMKQNNIHFKPASATCTPKIHPSAQLPEYSYAGLPTALSTCRHNLYAKCLPKHGMARQSKSGMGPAHEAGITAVRQNISNNYYYNNKDRWPFLSGSTLGSAQQYPA